jgi:hypothetical protein
MTPSVVVHSITMEARKQPRTKVNSDENVSVIYTIKSPERVSVTLLREPSSGHVSYFELGKAY